MQYYIHKLIQSHIHVATCIYTNSVASELPGFFPSFLDSKAIGCEIFTNVQKPLIRSLQKLDQYVIRGSTLEWFESYLKGRLQFVSINNASSSLEKGTCGFLQWSVLSSLLFPIYINDLPNISKALSFFLFADDTNAYFESEKFLKLQSKINEELLKVTSWLELNKLALKVQKIHYAIFYSPRKNLPDKFISFSFSFHFSLFNHGSPVSLHRLLCRGPCKKNYIITNLKPTLKLF